MDVCFWFVLLMLLMEREKGLYRKMHIFHVPFLKWEPKSNWVALFFFFFFDDHELS